MATKQALFNEIETLPINYLDEVFHFVTFIKQYRISNDDYLARLDELCGSIDDPTFVEPPEVPLKFNLPREEIA